MNINIFLSVKVCINTRALPKHPHQNQLVLHRTSVRTQLAKFSCTTIMRRAVVLVALVATVAASLNIDNLLRNAERSK